MTDRCDGVEDDLGELDMGGLLCNVCGGNNTGLHSAHGLSITCIW
jgi:hypothetical protein